MTKKFQSKSGLPEAIGSNPIIGPKPKKMCEWRNCQSRRVGKEVLPNGEIKHVYERGYGDVIIRTDNGIEHGYVCYACYMKVLEQAGLDQLSVAARTEAERVTQPDFKMRAAAPSGLIDHLTEIEHTVLKRASENASMESWMRDKEDFEQERIRDDKLAERYGHDAH